MNDSTGRPFLPTVPGLALDPARVPVLFHLLRSHTLPAFAVQPGESVAFRSQRFLAEAPPRPVSRCFPG